MRWIVVTIGLLSGLSGSAQNWDSLGAGMSSGVWTFYTDTASGIMYAGGNFGYANNLDVGGIAKWDGVMWDSLGSGIWNSNVTGPPVKAIAKYNGEIYAGGSFPTMGGIPVTGIARWDGVAWDSLGTGVRHNNNNPGVVTELMVYNNELYVGGNFYKAGGVPANSLAKWNGTQWSDVNGFPDYNAPNPNAIIALEVYNGELYAAGNFSDPGGYSDIVKYDGSNWVPLENGILGGMGGINTMAVYQGELYVGGLFYKSAGNVDDNIMKWNGTNWSEVAGGVDGLNGQVYDMTVFNGELYVVGAFVSAGGVPADRIAKWDGTEWCGFGSVFDNVITSIEAYNDTLYIGGGFWTIDGDSISRIAKWTGGSYVDTCGALTGLEEKEETNGLVIYPNPATNQFTVSGIGQYPAEISLFDLTGRQVLSKSIANPQPVDISHLPNGLYLWQVKTPDDTVRGKLVKQ